MELFEPRPGNKHLVIVLDRTGSMTEPIIVLRKLLAKYLIQRAEQWEYEKYTLVTFDDHYPGHRAATIQEPYSPEVIERYMRRAMEGCARHPTEPDKDCDYCLSKILPIGETIGSEVTNVAWKNYGTTDNLDEFIQWLHTVKLGNGGDGDECQGCAVGEAQFKAPDSTIWLVTDSHPHISACKKCKHWTDDYSGVRLLALGGSYVREGYSGLRDEDTVHLYRRAGEELEDMLNERPRT